MRDRRAAIRVGSACGRGSVGGETHTAAVVTAPGFERLGFARHVALVEAAAAALVERCGTAGPDAAVPTCPDWRVRDLMVHQGIVHRWAAGHLRRDEHAGAALAEADILATVGDEELAAWLRTGTRELLDTLATVAPEVPALVFLNDAARPREFWARRQAHETTIHAVDALAAALGRLPTADETGIDTELACDGIDEILRGFFTRGPSRLYAGRPVTVAVAPDDSLQRWTLRAGPDGAVTSHGQGGAADVTFTGTAVQLYLGLWNRGAEITATGDSTLLERWRTVQHVTWG